MCKLRKIIPRRINRLIIINRVIKIEHFEILFVVNSCIKEKVQHVLQQCNYNLHSQQTALEKYATGEENGEGNDLAKK